MVLSLPSLPRLSTKTTKTLTPKKTFEEVKNDGHQGKETRQEESSGKKDLQEITPVLK
jgi:hypothetical protein